MNTKSVLRHLAFLSIIFASAHALALKFSIYWTTSWFDSVMHIYGGLLSALLVLFILEKIGFSPKTLSKKIILLIFVLIAAFAIGVVWELWEIFVGFTDPFEVGALVDTVSDLIMDIVGSVIGFLYYEKKLRTK